MPAAALRLLYAMVMPAAMLCAEPLPRVAFPSGEWGSEGVRGLGRGLMGGQHRLGRAPIPRT